MNEPSTTDDQRSQPLPESPRPASPIFDRAGLADRLMDDEALVREIVACFVEDLPKQIRALQKHIRAGDAEAAGGQAHSIKGAAANVGGMALSAVAFDMEQAGKASQRDTLTALLPELDRQSDQLIKQMMKECLQEIPESS